MKIRTNLNQKNYKLKELINTYRFRQTVLWTMDISSIFISFFISKFLIENTKSITIQEIILPIVVYIILHTILFTKLGCYKSLWRYAGEEEMLSILIGSSICIILAYIIHNLIGNKYPLPFYILKVILIILFTVGIRIAYRVARRTKTKSTKYTNNINVLVVGAGNAGAMIIEEIKRNPQLRKMPVGIVDDDKNKIGRKIHNIRILGKIADIERIVNQYKVDEIILAIANIDQERKTTIIENCKKTKCKVKTIPGIFEIIDGKVDIKKVRDVDIEDLLGRESINTDIEKSSEYIKNKVVLVTGGGGSIGSELCRQIARFNPKHLIIVDNYENNAYAIQQELKRHHGDSLNFNTIIASIREYTRMEDIFKKYSLDIVFHAAAHKHVPLMESSPSEAIKNNIFGTKNVAELSHIYKVERFVLISTDKAVNPTNIMGATKRAAEMIIQSMNKISKTEFIAVRFGNVLGSNGSVIPLFKKQIEEGGPVTVTHPDIIRYFMTIQEAVQLVIQACTMAKGGEIFVLNMGKPVKIADLAKKLIKLSGFEPGVDIKIEYSGLRPGEKLYEELLMSEEGLTKTINKKIFIGKQIDVDRKKVERYLNMLWSVVEQENVGLIDKLMRDFVPTYIRPEQVNCREGVS